MVTLLATFLPIQILFVTNSVPADVVKIQINFSRTQLLDLTVGIATQLTNKNQQLKPTPGGYLGNLLPESSVGI